MARRLIGSGSSFERDIGFSRDVVEQVRQCFRNISAALSQAGASLEIEVTARRRSA